MLRRVREYERKRQYEEFKDRVGEIINGTVKRTEYGNLMVELGKAEALLRRMEGLPLLRWMSWPSIVANATRF